MASKRKDDPRPRPVYRSERMVKEGGKWFFYTREGTMEGPFESEVQALIQLDQYIRVVESGLLPQDAVSSFKTSA